MRFFLSLALFFSVLTASQLDIYYDRTYHFLSRSISWLDRWLSDTNKSAKEKFFIQTSIATITEGKEPLRFRFHINANLTLPRTKERLHLFLREFKESESIDSEVQKSLDNSIKGRSFLFGFQYLTTAHLRYRAGIRFHAITPDPFIGLGWEDTKYIKESSWLYYGDRISYYLARHLDNKLFCNFQHRIDTRTLFTFENSYRYKEKEHQITNALILYLSLEKNRFLTSTLSLYSIKDNVNGLHIDYYYTGINYHDNFLRTWLFYEIEPGIILRKKGHFDPNFRLMFKIGVIFNQE